MLKVPRYSYLKPRISEILFQNLRGRGVYTLGRENWCILNYIS